MKRIKAALSKIVFEYGYEVALDSAKLRACLKDILKNTHEGEIDLLVKLNDLDIPRKIYYGHLLDDEEITSAAAFISKKYFLQNKSVEKAIACWNDVIKPKNSEAAQELYCKAMHCGIDDDYIRLLSEAAKLGHMQSQHELGLCYYNGSRVDKDYAKAVKWFQKSHDQGNANSRFYLAYCLSNGLGIAKTKKKLFHCTKFPQKMAT